MSWTVHDNYGTDILQAKLHILVKNDIKSIVSITLFNYLPTKINQGFIKCFLSLGDTLLGVLLLIIFFILNLCWIDWCGRKVGYVHRFTYQFLKHNHITRSLGGIICFTCTTVHRFTYQNLKYNHVTRILGGMFGAY